jgi:hypothetical protein
MHTLLATSYGDLQQFLLWGGGFFFTISLSVVGFVFACMSHQRRPSAYRLSFLSLGGAALLALFAWLPTIDWHPNDRRSMMLGVMCLPWLPLISILVARARAQT